MKQAHVTRTIWIAPHVVLASLRVCHVHGADLQVRSEEVVSGELAHQYHPMRQEPAISDGISR
jgi:hypothetical protein